MLEWGDDRWLGGKNGSQLHLLKSTSIWGQQPNYSLWLLEEKGKSETFPFVSREKLCNRLSNEPPEYTFQCFESRPSNTTSGNESGINRWQFCENQTISAPRHRSPSVPHSALSEGQHAQGSELTVLFSTSGRKMKWLLVLNYFFQRKPLLKVQKYELAGDVKYEHFHYWDQWN